MLTFCWGDVTEETVQSQPQIDLDDSYIELQSNMERLIFYGFDKIAAVVAPVDFANFDNSVAAAEPVLYDKLIILKVHNSKIQEESESDEEDAD